MSKHDYALYKNTVLPVMLANFADVPVISETLVDTACDDVDGSADTVDELISTSTVLDTFCTPTVCLRAIVTTALAIRSILLQYHSTCCDTLWKLKKPADSNYRILDEMHCQ